MGLALVAAALALHGLASASTPQNLQGVAWDLDPTDTARWYVESDVVLPQYIQFEANANKQARVRTFQVRMVLDCFEVTEHRKTSLMSCTIEDAALGGVTFRSERGKLQPILEELDSKLTGAELRLTIRDTGRLRQVQLLEARTDDRRNRRINHMNEVLRLVAVRALAGFDLHLPNDGHIDGRGWHQYTDLLYGAPILTGTRGSTQIRHGVLRIDDDRLLVRSEGRGSTVPSATTLGENIFIGEMNAFGVFDLGSGMLTERRWQMAAMPTPSSPLAQGFSGLPYAQRGALRRLALGDTPDVGETLEWVPSIEAGPRALQGPFAWADTNQRTLLGHSVPSGIADLPL